MPVIVKILGALENFKGPFDSPCNTDEIIRSAVSQAKFLAARLVICMEILLPGGGGGGYSQKIG